MSVNDSAVANEQAVAVVGCNGALGSALVSGLLAAGTSVLGFDRDELPTHPDLDSYHQIEYSNLQPGLDSFAEVLASHPTPVVGLAVMTGLYPARLMHEETETSLGALFHANTIAPALVVNTFISATQPGPRSVVVTSSLAARRSRIGIGAYSATKIAFERLVSTLALEHREEGVRVNMVQPGYVASDSSINPVPEAYERAVKDSTGLTRPTDLVNSYLWLLGSTSGMVNGETISVDGGAHLGRKDEVAWLDNAD